jgi:hypothetical protein
VELIEDVTDLLIDDLSDLGKLSRPRCQ